MPRKTRAAAKAQEAVIADLGDAQQELPSPPTPKRDREPLRSITPNSVDSIDNERAPVAEMAKGKAKKGKKGAAKKKAKKAKETNVTEAPEQLDEVIEDSGEAADVSAEEAVVVEREHAIVDDTSALVAAESTPIERPQSSFGRSTRSTRRQVAKAEADAEAAVESVNAVTPSDIANDQPTINAVQEEAPPASQDATEPKAIAGELKTSPPLSDSAETVLVLESAISEQTESIEALLPSPQDLPDRTRPSPLSLVASNSTSRRASQVEEGIEALDALEDEIDEVAKIIPSLDSPLSPLKPQGAKSKLNPKTSVNNKQASRPTTVTAKAAPTRASKLNNTTQPSATSRIRSLAEPKKPVAGLARTGSVKTRPKSMVVDSKGKEQSSAELSKDSKPVDFLAAKRRPISVSFPTPPPPPKSTKPVTTSTFTLPGEAVAAKLKAQRLERQKREEEEAAKRREFNARPVPPIRPKPVEVKQTAASRARQSMIGDNEKENASGLKRSSTVTGANTTSASRNNLLATKRSSIIGGLKTSASATNAAQKRTSIIAPKSRPAPAAASLPKDRSPSNPYTQSSRSVSTSDTAAQRLKGKEVYNRDKVEKEAREKAQKEKDDALKKARAEAAERGRQASREWAEKQKRSAMDKKMKAASPAEAGASPITDSELLHVAV